jgi:hypothetical protein
MAALAKSTLVEYRSKTYRTQAGCRIASLDEAVEFVNQRGFIFFWPVKGAEAPSLWNAAAGDRPVPDEHDDPGHVTWGWKDALLPQKRVYYSRVLRHRNVFISLALLPSFYALSPNYGSPEEDYLIDYENGQLTAEAKAVYEAILDNGPLDTLALRKAARLASKSSDTLFNRALDVLQTSLRILPIGVAQVGAWNYAFIYQIVARHYPWVIEQAHPITESDARLNLAQAYLNSVGAACLKDVTRLFGWPAPLAEKTMHRLAGMGVVIPEITLENSPGVYFVLPELLAQPSHS